MESGEPKNENGPVPEVFQQQAEAQRAALAELQAAHARELAARDQMIAELRAAHAEATAATATTIATQAAMIGELLRRAEKAEDEATSGQRPTSGGGLTPIQAMQLQHAAEGTWYRPPAVPTREDVAQAVWNATAPQYQYEDEGNTTTVSQMLRQIAQFAHESLRGGVMTPSGLFAWVHGPHSEQYLQDVLAEPVFDWLDIGVMETLLQVLTRQNPSWKVYASANPGQVILEPPEANGTYRAYSRIDGPTFEWLKYFMYAPSSGPPERSLIGDLHAMFALLPVGY